MLTWMMKFNIGDMVILKRIGHERSRTGYIIGYNKETENYRVVTSEYNILILKDHHLEIAEKAPPGWVP